MALCEELRRSLEHVCGAACKSLGGAAGEGKEGRRNYIFKTPFIQETVYSQIRYAHIIYPKGMTARGSNESQTACVCGPLSRAAHLS